MLVASLLIYSGLENPRWTIVGAAEQLLLSQLQQLPVIPGGSAGLPGLGYSGVELIREIATGEVESWMLYDGTVAHAGRCFEDRGRRLERRVIELGRARLGDLIPQDLFWSQ